MLPHGAQGKQWTIPNHRAPVVSQLIKTSSSLCPYCKSINCRRVCAMIGTVQVILRMGVSLAGQYLYVSVYTLCMQNSF